MNTPCITTSGSNEPNIISSKSTCTTQYNSKSTPPITTTSSPSISSKIKSKMTRTLFHYFSPSPSPSKKKLNKNKNNTVTNSNVSNNNSNPSHHSSMLSSSQSSSIMTNNSSSQSQMSKSNSSNSFSQNTFNKVIKDKDRTKLATLSANILANQPQQEQQHQHSLIKVKTIETNNNNNMNNADSVKRNSKSITSTHENKKRKQIDNLHYGIHSNDRRMPMTKKQRLNDANGKNENKNNTNSVINTNTTNITPNNDNNNGIALGLIRVDSPNVTMQELCTTLSHIINNQHTYKIYPLFHGAILGRNEKIPQRTINNKLQSLSKNHKIDIDIARQENGISRNQLFVSSIIFPTECNSIDSNMNTKDMDKASLERYLKHQHLSCPMLEIESGKNVLNCVRVYTFGTSSCSYLLKKDKKTILRVGDTIVFDAYNGTSATSTAMHKSNGKPKYVYRVIAYQPGFKKQRTNTVSKQIHKIDIHTAQDQSMEQPSKRTEPSCNVEDKLDMTVEKSVMNESELIEVDEVAMNHKIASEEKSEVEMENNVVDATKRHLIRQDDKSKQLIDPNRPSKERLSSPTNEMVIRDYDRAIESDNETLNLSQDSFFDNFECVESKPTTIKPEEMPSMTSNSLWRALNSSQPQNGFGFLMNLAFAMNVIPNTSLLRNFSIFLQNGPACEGILFKDFRRTELTGMYLEFVMKMMARMEGQVKLNIAPSEWSDFEDMLNLPMTQTERIDTTSTPRLALALHMASTTLKIVALSLESELLPAIQDQMELDKKVLYDKQPLVSLILQNEIRNSLKTVVRLAIQCWTRHGHWIFGLRSKSQFSDVRKVTKQSVNLGEIGYTFVKHFPGHGNFRGTVVEVWPDKSRRCVYTDGDFEDLSIKDLRKLEKDEKQRQNEKNGNKGKKTITNNSDNFNPKSASSSEEEHCITSCKSCLDSFGSIVSYLSWLYCVEECIEFGHDDCCFLIKDVLLGELQNVHYASYIDSGKKATAATKKKVLTGLKLRFVLSMDTVFSKDLQVRLGSMLGVSSELQLIGI